MKKLMVCIALAGLLLLGIGAVAEADLTLLVYMCGGDLQDAACYDIYEMGIAETGDNVNMTDMVSFEV